GWSTLGNAGTARYPLSSGPSDDLWHNLPPPGLLSGRAPPGAAHTADHRCAGAAPLHALAAAGGALLRLPDALPGLPPRAHVSLTLQAHHARSLPAVRARLRARP